MHHGKKGKPAEAVLNALDNVLLKNLGSSHSCGYYFVTTYLSIVANHLVHLFVETVFHDGSESFSRIRIIMSELFWWQKERHPKY